jgi:hypothetical protein
MSCHGPRFNNKSRNNIRRDNKNRDDPSMSPPSDSNPSPISSRLDPLHHENENKNKDKNKNNHSRRTPSNNHPPTSFWSYLVTNLTDPCCGTSDWMYHEEDEQDDDDDFSLSLASKTEVEDLVHNYKNYELNHRMASF